MPCFGAWWPPRRRCRRAWTSRWRTTRPRRSGCRLPSLNERNAPMTIRKGEAWGTPGALPDNGVVVGSDAEARAVVEEARRAGRPPPVLGLSGGDLWRTLGGTTAERLHSESAMTFPVDLGSVLAARRIYWCLCPLVATT